MSEPTTAAGRALWADLIVDVNSQEASRITILAIEAEARAAALDRDLLARAMAYVRDGHDAQWRDYIREADGLIAAIDALRERSGDLTAAQKSAALMSLITERERSGE